MNDAAGDICVQNPIMLSVRGELLELARKRVNDSGYEYKKGKSRSKRFGSAGSVEASTPKRPKLDQEFRTKRMQQIKEEVKTINTQVSFKERRVEAGAQLKNFKVCDQLTDEISELQKQRRALEMELQCLEKKEKSPNGIRSKKYLGKEHSLLFLQTVSHRLPHCHHKVASFKVCRPQQVLHQVPCHMDIITRGEVYRLLHNLSQDRVVALLI